MIIKRKFVDYRIWVSDRTFITDQNCKTAGFSHFPKF